MSCTRKIQLKILRRLQEFVSQSCVIFGKPPNIQVGIGTIFNKFPLSISQPSMRREVTRYMEPGHWFLSIYNDDGDAQEITFYGAVAEDMTQNCPNGCSGNGQCLLGHCQCNPGYGGDDCSESKFLEILRAYFDLL